MVRLRVGNDPTLLPIASPATSKMRGRINQMMNEIRMDPKAVYVGSHERLPIAEAAQVAGRFAMVLFAAEFNRRDAESWSPEDAMEFGIAYPFSSYASFRLGHNVPGHNV